MMLGEELIVGIDSREEVWQDPMESDGGEDSRGVAGFLWFGATFDNRPMGVWCD